MNITVDQKTQVIELIREKYPDWNGFDHREFRQDEISDKRTLVKKATSMLREDVLAQLLVTREVGNIINRLEHIAKASDLLGESDTAHGHLEILYIPTLDKPVYCAQVYHLLHGTESVSERLDAYFRYVKDHELPHSWAFPTYLLHLCYPSTELFVESRSIGWFANHVGLSAGLGKPNTNAYMTIRQYAHELRRALGEYRPQDMVDIFGALRVCSEVAEKRAGKSNGMTWHANGDGVDFDEEFASPKEDVVVEAVEDADATLLFIPDSPQGNSGPDIAPAATPAPAATSLPENMDYEVSPAQQERFRELYQEFVTNFMSSPAGVARAAFYAKSREQAEQNFAHLVAEHELGEDVTDRVFLHLLPHPDARQHHDSGAWLHPRAGLDDTFLTPYDSQRGDFAGHDRKDLAEALLNMIRTCAYRPAELPNALAIFRAAHPDSRLSAEHISPVLNSLKSDGFLLANESAAHMITFFGGPTMALGLDEYPELSRAGLDLVQYFRHTSQAFNMPSMQHTDLFDMFCHWAYYTRGLVEEEEAQEEDEDTRPPTPPETIAPEASIAEAPAVEAPAKKPAEDSEPMPAPTNGTLPPFSIKAFTDDTGMSEEELDRWLRILRRKQHVILEGAPGMGKTYLAHKLALALATEGNGLFETIVFHPGFSYTDLFGTKKGPDDGLFTRFCQIAANRQGPCVLVIDEFNRADSALVFGELLYLLEHRGQPLTLAHGVTLTVPKNIYIIGTQTPLDEQTPMDPVFARRFAVLTVPTRYATLRAMLAGQEGINANGLVRVLEQVNDNITDPFRHIGISYFTSENLADHIEDIWKTEVYPYIQEHLNLEETKHESFNWSRTRRRIIKS